VPRRAPAAATLAGAFVAVLVLAGCGADDEGPGSDVDPAQVDSLEVPELGACRVLTPEDVAAPSNATRTVDCAEEHTAETFAVGTLPDDLHDEDYDSPELGRFAYETCGSAFETFLGADESLAMRTVVSWAWFRPSEDAWDAGARWYRCDVVGGGPESAAYAPLPRTARGLLTERPDRWLVCAVGETVTGSRKVPCTERHDWRAVTTIKLGEPEDRYPGDREVEVTTRDFCSDSVGAWLGYPLDYEFGYTWFGEGEWEAGNRRSICWARTPR